MLIPIYHNCCNTSLVREIRCQQISMQQCIPSSAFLVCRVYRADPPNINVTWPLKACTCIPPAVPPSQSPLPPAGKKEGKKRSPWFSWGLATANTDAYTICCMYLILDVFILTLVLEYQVGPPRVH